MRENIVRGLCSYPMSLDDFYHRADQYVANITVAQKSLVSIYKLLRAGKNIAIDQYKSITDLIPLISEPVDDFCQLLETPAELPVAVVPLRYLLATALYDVDEQANELIQIVTKFRIRDYRQSRKIIKQDIRNQLGRLIKSCTDVKQEYCYLAEELISRAKITSRLSIVRFVSYS